MILYTNLRMQNGKVICRTDMENPLSILLIEDKHHDRFTQQRENSQELDSLKFFSVRNKKSFSAALKKERIDFAVLDYQLDWACGEDLLNLLHRKHPNATSIVFSENNIEKLNTKFNLPGIKNYIIHTHEEIKRLPEIIKDVVNRQTQENILRSYQEKYETLFDHVPIGLFRASPDGEITHVNKAAVNMFGYQNSQEMIAATKKNSYKDDNDIQSLLEVLKNQSEIRNHETRLPKADGSPLYVNLHIRVINDDKGNPSYFEGSAEDITHRKLVEEELKKSLHLNKAIIESAKEGIIVYDTELRYRVFNNFMEEIMGVKAEKVIGKVATEIFPHLAEYNVGELLKRALNGENVRSGDVPFYIAESGKKGWTEGQYSPLKSESGEIIGVIATVHEITKRKNDETERQNLLDQERKRARELGALAATATTIASNKNIQDVLKLVAEQLVNMLDISMCTISSWDNKDNQVVLLSEHHIAACAPNNNWLQPIPLDSFPNLRKSLIDQSPVQIQTNEPKITDSCMKFLENWGLESVLFVPLISQDKTIGMIQLGVDNDPRVFNDQELVIAQMLANQTGIAIENSKLLKDAQKQLNELSVLHAISIYGADATDEDKLIAYATNLIYKTFYPENCGVLLLDPSQKHLIQHTSYHSDDRVYFAEIPVNTGVTGRVAQSGKAEIIPNAKADPDYLVYDPKMRSEICAPLKAGNTILGVLNAESSQENAFGDNDKRLILTLASQIAVTIQKIRTQKAELHHTRNLTLLNQLAKDMTGLLNTRNLCNLVTSRLCSDFGYLNCGIFSWKPGDEYLHLEGISGHHSPVARAGEYRQHITEGLLGKAVRKLNITLANDISKEEDYLTLENDVTQSELVIPLIVDGKIIGGMIIDSDEKNAFQESDVETLSTLADQLAVAMEKTRLFETEKLQREQAETLREVVAIISNSTEKDSLLKLILAELQKVVRYDGASIMQIKGDKLSIEAVGGSLSPDIIGYSFSLNDNLITHPMIYDAKTVAYKNVKNAPAWINSPGSEKIISWIGSPLIVRGECIGVLTVDGYRESQFNKDDTHLVATFASHAASAIENARLYEELEDSFIQTVLALANAMDVRDSYTHNHSQRIAYLTYKVGKELGLTEPELETLRLASLLHDIGKIGIPDDILLKPAKLTDEEYKIIQRHPALGAEIVAPVKKLSDVAPIIRNHQEKWDGRGYPDGLKREEIPLGSRILAVVDSYIAMTDERIYRQARQHEEALEIINQLAGKQYDPAVVKAFAKVIGEQKLIEAGQPSH